MVSFRLAEFVPFQDGEVAFGVDDDVVALFATDASEGLRWPVEGLDGGFASALDAGAGRRWVVGEDLPLAFVPCYGESAETVSGHPCVGGVEVWVADGTTELDLPTSVAIEVEPTRLGATPCAGTKLFPRVKFIGSARHCLPFCRGLHGGGGRR